MDMQSLMPLFVAMPLAAAFLIAVSHQLPQRLLDGIAVLFTAALVLLSVSSLPPVLSKKMLLYTVGSWPNPLGIRLVMDGLSVFMLITVNILVFLLMIYSAEYMEKYTGKWKYYTIFMILLAGLNGVLLSADLFNLFVFLELSTLSAYILTSFNREAESFEASFKYAILGTLSSLFILLAIALIYSRISSLSLADISRAWMENRSLFSLQVILLLVVGFGLKATLVPFHAWVPDAYTVAPAPASAVFTGAVSKVTGIYLLARFFYNIAGPDPLLLNTLAVLGVISILTGVILALYQWDFKRLLSYHSISQIGYIILGLGLGTPLGIIGGLFHLINHTVFKSLLFLNAGSVEYATGTRNLKELGGLAQRMPVTGTTSMIASLSISGIPPLNGFWSKLIIVIACVQASHYWFAFFAVLGSLLTLASFLKVQRYVFYGFLKDAWREVKEVPILMTIPMLMLAVLCVGMGILLLPGVDTAFLKPAVDTLLNGKGYAQLMSGLLK